MGRCPEAAQPQKVVDDGGEESLVSLFLAFGCLPVAWLCVAAGLRRATD